MSARKLLLEKNSCNWHLKSLYKDPNGMITFPQNFLFFLLSTNNADLQQTKFFVFELTRPPGGPGPCSPIFENSVSLQNCIIWLSMHSAGLRESIFDIFELTGPPEGTGVPF